MNETFCRALLRAGLTEEDVAARLGVDPKTVRRWIEGRALPYRRYRWALAALLSEAESDLWPQLRTAQPRPEEVVAIYPHLSSVPRDMWLRLFGSAEGDISILDAGRLLITLGRDLVTTLAGRARAGVTTRICLTDPGAVEQTAEPKMGVPNIDLDSALERYAPLRDNDAVQIRLPQGAPYSFIYRADDQLLVAQRAFGVPIAKAPVIHLQRTVADGMFATYIESFERAWAGAAVPKPSIEPR